MNPKEKHDSYKAQSNPNHRQLSRIDSVTQSICLGAAMYMTMSTILKRDSMPNKICERHCDDRKSYCLITWQGGRNNRESQCT
jgi:hypothetical protein